jgi:hypothetical protein
MPGNNFDDKWEERENEDIVDEDNDDDPTDPNSPDFDLSTAADYDYDDYEAPYRGPWFTRRWVLILVAFVAIMGFTIPIAVVLLA